MKNIKFKTYLQLICFLIILSSCNDWLDDVKQTTRVTDEIVWKEESTVNSYVNSFYTFLHDYGQFGTKQFNGSLTESLTETFKYGSHSPGNRAGHPNTYVLTPEAITTSGGLYSVWSDAYRDIREINQFLDLQKKYSEFSEEKNLLWEAQARFFRAFVYFQLAKRHDGVILYTDLNFSNDMPRSTANQTWDLIAEDLDFAVENLPVEWSTNDKGRVTKGAASALKSRAMLYAERWQDAYDAANDVIELEIYDIVSDYSDAWKGNNIESILEFNYSILGPNHDFDQYYVSAADGYEYGSLGTPTQEMVESYEKANGVPVDWSQWHSQTTARPPWDELEPRFHATVIYQGSRWKDKVMDCSVGGINGEFMPYREQPYSYGKTTTGYFLKKLLDEDLRDVRGTPSTQPWVEIRYAEVLLNKAEAAFRLNKLSEAQELVNKVRARVDLPGKYSSGDAWFKDYRNERKVELSYEGHLFWDMRRWRLAHTEYNNYRVHGIKIIGNTYEYVDCDYEDRRFLQRLYVLPIPDSEIQNNSIVEQYDEWK